MNADDDGLGFDVQFCGERICYQIFYIQGDSGGKVNILRGDSVGSLWEESSYEPVSNYEWLPRWSCLNLQT